MNEQEAKAYLDNCEKAKIANSLTDSKELRKKYDALPESQKKDINIYDILMECIGEELEYQKFIKTKGPRARWEGGRSTPFH